MLFGITPLWIYCINNWFMLYTNIMYLYVKVTCYVFCIFVFYVSVAGADQKTQRGKSNGCEARISTCELHLGNNTRKLVCGSDGRTYQSRCQIMRAQCSGEPVAFAHRGACIEGQSSCLITLRYVLKAPKARRGNFIPKCRPDGTYAAVQCATAGAGAGCWCVTPDGKHMSNTAVRNGKPDCTKTGKSHTRRRSSARGQKTRRSCTRKDRIQFNANLMKIFNGEHDRSKSASLNATVAPTTVADWKFNELDRDRSGALQKSEYRGIRKLIKKMVKPKRCARAWIRGCDGDGNGSIERAEWISCLLAIPQAPAPDYDEGKPEPDPGLEEEEPSVDPTSVLPSGLMKNAFAPEGSETNTRRDDDVNDCLTDRQTALEEQKSGGNVLYVPECTGDGRYARAQCYKSTGYCWCVHQDTGKPIPGSSIKDQKPECDSFPVHASPMRGCPEPMKANFLRDLKRFFVTKMTSATSGTVPGEMVKKWVATKEEQAAKWTFVILDKDKNTVLERREWKTFHQLINNQEQLRRCSRKLPRYCDVNHDNKISLTEWLACLEISQTLQGTQNTTETASSRRRGPNPLESILKAEDK